MSLLDRRPTEAKKGGRAARMAESTRNYLFCPHCGGPLRQIRDSRPSVIGSSNEAVVRRQRRCDQCSLNSATIEVSEAYILRLRAETLKEIALAIISGDIT